MNSFVTRLRVLLLVSFASLFAACSGSKDAGTDAAQSGDAPAPDNTAEVAAYYAAHPEFFVVKTPADLPAGLVWEDGADLPELGSPERKRGGTFQGRIQDFPRTLRTVGPDSNSGFRGIILDENALSFGQLHPNVPGPHRYFPGLASAWAIDLPAKTVYVRIDPAARWSDGPPVTTDDVFFMFWFFQGKYIQAPWYNNYYGIGETYTRVTRYDNHTFAVTLTEARPDLLGRVLGLRPIPRHFYRELGDDYVSRYNWRFEPTTGPWVITDAELKRTATARNHITLNRLADWWANDKRQFRYRYNPEATRLRVIRETTKAWEAFLLGELDAFGMNLAEYNYERLPDDAPLVRRGLIHKTTFFNDVPRPNYGLWMNTAKAPLDDQNVRLGIQHATHWQLVIDQYFRGDYTRLHTSNQGYGDMSHPTIRGREFDVAKAREYFARAGFTQPGPDGILRKPDGTRLSVGLTTGYEALAPVLTILQEEARKAGIEYRVEILDASAAWKKVQEKNHDITFSAFGIGVELYPRYWETHHSSNAYDQPFLEDGKTPNPARKAKVQTNNLEAVAIAELDALITAYDNSDNLDDMRRMAHRMEEILYEHASFSPGFALPFFRTANWRWVNFPEGHAYRFSGSPFEYGVEWLDEAAKAETLAALRDEAKTFPPAVKIFDQWKTKE
ncbi:MAG: extracellular solute-binding protein [Opitutaceae bacterium]|jgi:microcin C transport system substrate-binding protein|nr:extracellular solute-binding protein [Opitutaceae bacterium]